MSPHPLSKLRRKLPRWRRQTRPGPIIFAFVAWAAFWAWAGLGPQQGDLQLIMTEALGVWLLTFFALAVSVWWHRRRDRP